jgi:hypothetical protein
MDAFAGSETFKDHTHENDRFGFGKLNEKISTLVEQIRFGNTGKWVTTAISALF